MFKALLLQQWYGLSDPGLEEAICDRLSFSGFWVCLLPTRFRMKPGFAGSALCWPGGVGERLFALLEEQLHGKG